MLGQARHGGMPEKAEQDGGTEPHGHPRGAEEATNHGCGEIDDACTATGGAPLAMGGAQTRADGAQLGTGDVRAKRKSGDEEMGTKEMALIWQPVTGL